MEWVGIVLFAVGVLAVLVLVLYLFQRSLDKPGGREGLGTMGNGMGVMDNFFSPSRADAKEELERAFSLGRDPLGTGENRAPATAWSASS